MAARARLAALRQRFDRLAARVCLVLVVIYKISPKMGHQDPGGQQSRGGEQSRQQGPFDAVHLAPSPNRNSGRATRGGPPPQGGGQGVASAGGFIFVMDALRAFFSWSHHRAYAEDLLDGLHDREFEVFLLITELFQLAEIFLELL
jgi:hypothetical protein